MYGALLTSGAHGRMNNWIHNTLIHATALSVLQGTISGVMSPRDGAVP